MLTDKEELIIQKLRDIKNFVENECEDCSSLSACNKTCLWHAFMESVYPILCFAESKTESEKLESLF